MAVRQRTARDRSDYCVFSGLAGVWGLTRLECTNKTRREEGWWEREQFFPVTTFSSYGTNVVTNAYNSSTSAYVVLSTI